MAFADTTAEFYRHMRAFDSLLSKAESEAKAQGTVLSDRIALRARLNHLLSEVDNLRICSELASFPSMQDRINASLARIQATIQANETAIETKAPLSGVPKPLQDALREHFPVLDIRYGATVAVVRDAIEKVQFIWLPLPRFPSYRLWLARRQTLVTSTLFAAPIAVSEWRGPLKSPHDIATSAMNLIDCDIGARACMH